MQLVKIRLKNTKKETIVANQIKVRIEDKDKEDRRQAAKSLDHENDNEHLHNVINSHTDFVKYEELLLHLKTYAYVDHEKDHH